jgi:cytochrome c-type biogenesis protein CcmH/NrfG
MQKVIVRHINGKRANQTDEFEVGNFSELLVGRDESAAVRFDPTGDDLVSRRHLQIAPDRSQPGRFQVIDLQSRNGTFLNRQRIYAPATISHGDLVQLGPGGPEFRFELDPAPNSMARPTREVNAGGYTPGSSMPTREVSLVQPMSAAPEIRSDSPRPVGRATVERMLGESFKRVSGESRKTMWAAIGASLVVLAAGVLFYLRLNHKAQESEDLAHQQQMLLQQLDAQVQQQPSAMSKQLGELNEELKKSSSSVSQSQAELAHLIAEERQAKVDGSQPQSASRGGAVATPASQPAATPASQPAATPAPPKPEDSPYTQQMSQIESQWNSGQHDQAMQSLQKLIASSPQRWEGFMMAGNYDKQMSMFPDALLAYEQAKDLAPDPIKTKLQAAIQQISAQLGSGSVK